MKIKDVISQTGIPEKTIRYYESQGLIHPVTERRGGRTYHEFRSEDVAALNAIVVLRKAQFSIEEIRTMQQDPEKIPQISAGLRRRIQAEADAMTRLLSVEDVFSAPDYQALSRQIAAAFQSQPDYVPPFRFGAEDPETPEEKAAAIAAYQKRHSRRPWIAVIAVLSVLCATLAVGLGYMVYREASAIPDPSGTTEGWVYYTPDRANLMRCKADGSSEETLYTSDLGGDIQNSNIIVTDTKVYFVDMQRLFSINADGSGLHQFKPRYYSAYSQGNGLPMLAGEYLYIVEYSSGQLGGSSSCLVKLSLQDGTEEKLSNQSGTPLAAKDDILYLLHKTVDAYGAENADETVYTYSLIAYDTQTDKVLTQKDLGNWDRECHGISNGETILLVRVDSMTQNTLLTLNTETLELEPYAEIPGQVQDVFGPYCCYDGDFAGTELGGTYLGWYVRNMDTGEAVHYDNDYYFCGFTEAGFLSRSNVSGSDPALVPYP